MHTRTESKLFSYSASYRTPSGRKTCVIGVKRGRIYDDYLILDDGEWENQLLLDAIRNICVDICADPKRKVALGLSGIIVDRIEALEPIVEVS